MKQGRLKDPRQQGGFTLLELLVATAVGAIVLLAINATFFGALRLHNTTHDKIDADLAVQRALGIVRSDLAGLMLPGGILAGQLQTNVSSSVNQGTYGDRVGPDFFTNSGKVDGWNPYSEVQMVDYFLAPATDGSNSKSLVRVVTRNLLPVQEPVPDVQVLLPGIAAATVEFYDGAVWSTDWDSQASATMPKAIRFSLVPQPSDPSLPLAAIAPIVLVVPVLVTTTTSQRQATAAAGGTGT